MVLFALILIVLQFVSFSLAATTTATSSKITLTPDQERQCFKLIDSLLVKRQTGKLSKNKSKEKEKPDSEKSTLENGIDIQKCFEIKIDSFGSSKESNLPKTIEERFERALKSQDDRENVIENFSFQISKIKKPPSIIPLVTSKDEKKKIERLKSIARINAVSNCENGFYLWSRVFNPSENSPSLETAKNFMNAIFEPLIEYHGFKSCLNMIRSNPDKLLPHKHVILMTAIPKTMSSGQKSELDALFRTGS